VQQAGWWIEHPEDAEEGSRHVFVVLGDGQQAVEVAADESVWQRCLRGDFGKRAVGARRQFPGVLDRSVGSLEVTSRDLVVAVLQAARESFCLQGGDCHALPVDRVEAADRVADDQQRVGDAPQAFVAAAYTGGIGVGRDLVERFGLFDRGMDVSVGDRRSERVRASLSVGGWCSAP
jgi:hypothetical protein